MAEDPSKKAEEAKKSLKEIESIVGALDDGFRELTSRLTDVVDEIKEGSEQLNSFNSVTKDITRSIRGLSKVNEDLIKNQIKLNQNKISSKDIDEQINKITSTRTVLSSRLASLQNKITDEGTATIAQQNEILKLQSALKEVSEEVEGEFKKQRIEAEKLEATAKKIDKDLGAFAGVLKGIGKIPILGDLIDTKKALEAAREETEKTGSGVKGLGAGLKNLKGQFIDSITNPANLALLAITQFMEALKSSDKATGDLAKSFNITYDEAANVRNELIAIGNSSGDIALNAKNLQETLVAVGQSLGSNAKLNEADLKTFTKLREQAGFTNEELIGIEKTTLATGGNLEDNTKKLLYSAKLTSLNNKVLLNEKDIMRDVSKASDAIKLSLAGNPEALGKAAAQAKALGMSLEQVDKIADSLLNFEQSISSELEAELLTGKNLNLEQARLYALNNDMEGLSREIAKNFGSAAEFSKMNRLQQESAAKAVGMSREELAKTLTDQAALKGLTGDQADKAKEALAAARAKGMSEEEIAKTNIENLMKQQSVQERLNNSVEKLKEVFISIAEPILQIVSPLTDLLNDILPPIIGLLQPVLGTFKAIAHVVAGIVKFLTLDFSGALSSFSKVPEDLMKGITSSTQFKMLRLLTGSETTPAGDLVSPGGGYGTRTLLSPEGSFALNDKDTVIAGTKLFKGNDVTSSPAGANMFDMSETNALLKQLINKDQTIAIAGEPIAKVAGKNAQSFSIETNKLSYTIQ